MGRAGHVARMGGERKLHKVFVGNPKGNRPLGRPRPKWEDGFRTDLAGDLIRLVQDKDQWRAIVNAVMNFRVLCPRSQLRIMNLKKISIFANIRIIIGTYKIYARKIYIYNLVSEKNVPMSTEAQI
jgi:hypothetical protein